MTNASQKVALSKWSLKSKQEPIIRVGVVLPEDGMSTVEILAPATGYTLITDEGSLPLPQQKLVIRAEDGRVMLSDSQVSSSFFRITPPPGRPLSRKDGLTVFGVVVGRGFHWQRCIDLTFTGVFEFRAAASRLLGINDLLMEEYLVGVIAAEMSGDCPLEFLRSQCVVARSWVLAHTEDKHSELGIDRCNDDCCQRYQGTHDITPTAIEAVRSTRGQVVVSEAGEIIDANYSKSCGGIIEAPEHVWGLRKAGQRAEVDAPAGSPARKFFPLKQEQLFEFISGDWAARTDIFCSPAVVPDADLPRYLGKVDDGGGHFRWQFRYTREEMESILHQKVFSRQKTADPLKTLIDIQVIARGDSGRAKLIRLDYLDLGGRRRSLDIHTEYNIRNALHPSFLYSSAFVVQISGDSEGVPTEIQLLGAGWGHGAGLCQIGALGMALKGYRAEEILHHYFSPVRIETCY